MRAGRLDRFITIQRDSNSVSASGAPSKTWTTIVSRRPASMTPVKGEERFNQPQINAQEQIEFRIHYSSDVADLSPLDRIIHPALGTDSPSDDPLERHIHDILAVHEIGRREGLKIITQRRPDVTT
jgi:head-tail adaptor